METLGGDFEGVDKDGINDAGPWDGLHGSVTESAAVRQRDLVGDRGNAEDPGGVSPPFSQIDHRYELKTGVGQEVGISPGGSFAGSRGLTIHSRVHLETEVKHPNTY